MELSADASLMGKSSDIQTVGLSFQCLRSAEVQKQKGGFYGRTPQKARYCRCHPAVSGTSACLPFPSRGYKLPLCPLGIAYPHPIPLPVKSLRSCRQLSFRASLRSQCIHETDRDG